MPTVRCRSCSEWHHQPCVIALDVEPLTYVCARCQVSVNGVSWNSSEINQPLFFPFLKKPDAEQAGPHLEALELTPPLQLHPGQAQSLHDLATVLLKRFQQKGDFKDLEESIWYNRTVLELLPAHHPTQPFSLDSLGVTLNLRFERTGDFEDLDESIRCHREALVQFPAHGPNWPVSLANLAHSLSTRFCNTGKFEDLDESIRCYQEALELSPAHSHRSRWFDVLASALSRRFDAKGDIEDLDESIRCHREALELKPT